MISKTRVLVTGSAGFIGHHLMLALKDLQFEVVGLDIINDYYDPELKYARLAAQGFEHTLIRKNACISSKLVSGLTFTQLDLSDKLALEQLFLDNQFDIVIHLAAQAGVLYSLENPMAYVESNLVGFVNILEACRRYPVKHFLFASSSSVYGLNTNVPFAITDNTDYPISFYAATKKANEVMAYSYAHLYGIPTSGMRFFTVYGPWGRPDMACFHFAKQIAEDKPIKLYNQGNMQRDFTYIDDAVAAIVKLLNRPPSPSLNSKQTKTAPYRLYNIGNNKPEHLLELVAILERLQQKKARLEYLPMQPGDMPITYANVDELAKSIHYRPSTRLEDGLSKFIDWFESYYATRLVA